MDNDAKKRKIDEGKVRHCGCRNSVPDLDYSIILEYQQMLQQDCTSPSEANKVPSGENDRARKGFANLVGINLLLK